VLPDIEPGPTEPPTDLNPKIGLSDGTDPDPEPASDPTLVVWVANPDGKERVYVTRDGAEKDLPEIPAYEEPGANFDLGDRVYCARYMKAKRIKREPNPINGLNGGTDPEPPTPTLPTVDERIEALATGGATLPTVEEQVAAFKRAKIKIGNGHDPDPEPALATE
jgi:hypothetical protein